jgi:hypothetical protein
MPSPGRLLLLNLSYNTLKQAQINSVFVQQEKVDRVGFEPTTSAPSSEHTYPKSN